LQNTNPPCSSAPGSRSTGTTTNPC
jgi:hypothetical protein